MNREPSVFDQQLLNLAEGWIREGGEMYVIARFSTGGYHAHEFLFTKFEQYVAWLRTLPSRADVTLFRAPQLPYRGIADEAFKALVLEHWKPRDEWTIVELKQNERLRKGAWNSDEEELNQMLSEFRGELVAAGPTPPWWEQDHSGMLSGIVPMEDGSVQLGIY